MFSNTYLVYIQLLFYKSFISDIGVSYFNDLKCAETGNLMIETKKMSMCITWSNGRTIKV